MSPAARRLNDAIQAYVNEIDEEAPVLVRGAVIAWESVNLDEDGDAGFKTNYFVFDGTTLAQSIGLFRTGARDIEDDVYGND